MKIIAGEIVAYLSVYPNEMEAMHVAWEIKLIPSSNGTKLLIHLEQTLCIVYFIDDFSHNANLLPAMLIYYCM